LRTVEGFVQVLEAAGYHRHLLRGPAGLFGSEDFAVFPSAEAAKSKPFKQMIGLAQINLRLADDHTEWSALAVETSLIVIGCYGPDSFTPYEFYGAMPPGGPANTTLHASYLGTDGEWRPFATFAAAKACADEVVRQGRSRPIIAAFSLTLL
jgi:hypothetical protein